MNVAIVGSRSFTDYSRLKRELDNIREQGLKIGNIITGGAIGTDSLAERYADENKISKMIILPNWSELGKIAGFERNTLIVDRCDYLIAFWDGKSKGTKDSIRKAKKQKKLFMVVYV